MNADEYYHGVENESLGALDVCLSFDDSLLCQYEIAAPIMKRRNLNAFFFLYSSPFSGELNYLEIFRHFRTTAYESINDFYSAFFEAVKTLYPSEFDSSNSHYQPHEYLSVFPFYSENDRWFRYLRDITLGSTKYYELMVHLMSDNNYNVEDVISTLWMTEDHVKSLRNNGHIIGLHSYSHPTELSSLNYVDQRDEYKKNIRHIEKVTGRRPKVVAHPVNSYGPGTLKILDAMGIEIGFRSNMFKADFCPLEYPREDCANIIKNNSARSQAVGVNQCL